MPYPQHLESTGLLRDGTPVALRPVRVDDEKLLRDLLAHMTREDVRMRFFAPLRELSHALAERLLHIDYDLQMALVAEHDSTPLGVARYAADADKLRAEFAVAVRSDWKGRGIGTLLMTRLIAVAQHAGIGELVGQVLHENKSMLDLCRALGFALTANLGDATITLVRKKL